MRCGEMFTHSPHSALREARCREFTRGDEVIAFPIDLTAIQKEMIRLLGLPPHVYK